MADKTVSVKLVAEVEGFTAGMRKAKSSVDDLTKAAAPSKADAFKSLAGKAALAGAAIAVGIGVAVKRFADFDEAMSSVQANTGATGVEFEGLRALAIKLGADSQYSAKEAAQGINEMAKAGISTADIMGGGLKGALDLAAAGQLGVGQAAEIAATAMTLFNLKGSQVGHVADLLAAGANKAQGGVADLGSALGAVGLVANTTGMSIEETVGGLTAFASAGLVGAEAGTTFKSMLQRLTPQSAEAQNVMDDLGISAYDAQGNFIGLANFAQNLKDSLKDLTPEARNAALATMFGSRAVNAATILYREGADGINKWTSEVNQAGFAADQAATLTDNLNGDIERLGGAFDSVLIQSGSSANTSLRFLVQTLTSFVDYMGKVPGPVILAGAALASIALVAPKAILTFRSYAKQLDALGISFERLEIKAPRLASGLKNVAQAAALFAVAATAVYAFADATEKINADKLAEDLKRYSDGLAVVNKELAAQTDNGWGRVSSDIDSFSKALGAAFNPGLVNNIDNAIGSFKTVFGGENVSNIQNATRQIEGIDQALANLVGSGSSYQAAQLFAQMTEEANRQGISVEDLKKKFPAYAAALAQAGTAATTAAGQTATMGSAADALEVSAEDAKKALDALKSAIEGLGGPVAAQRAATRDYEAAIDAMTAGLKENGKTLDDNKEKGRANGANLDAIAQKAKAKAAADYVATEATKGTTAATQAATTALQNGRTAFVNAAVAAGRTKAEANRLADSLGLIPKNIKILVGQTGASDVEATLQALARNRTATITVKMNQVNADTGRVDRTSGGARAGFAAGGPIPGSSPHPKADNIPVWATAGEFMQPVSSVSKYGHGFMEDVRTGRFPVERARGYAYGGPVRPNYGTSAPMMGRGSSIDYGRLASAVRDGSVTYNAYGLDVDAALGKLRRQMEWELAGR